MKQNSPSMECSGSLTPELEGASRTVPHPKRTETVQANSQTKKGGAKYE